MNTLTVLVKEYREYMNEATVSNANRDHEGYRTKVAQAEALKKVGMKLFTSKEWHKEVVSQREHAFSTDLLVEQVRNYRSLSRKAETQRQEENFDEFYDLIDKAREIRSVAVRNTSYEAFGKEYKRQEGC